MSKNISILGSTGSIGRQTLDIVAKSNGQLKITGLAAGTNIELLQKQIAEFKPKIVAVKRAKDVQTIKTNFPAIKVFCEQDGLTEVACFEESEVCVVAIVGVVALLPTIEAIKRKKTIAFASKEILVAAGNIVMPLLKEHGAKLFPVDSEHSAVMQLLSPKVTDEGVVYQTDQLRKIILTASGGAFRDEPLAKLAGKKANEAQNHPVWNMGKKITVDSATLMNKGLEVIEAHWLFDIPYEKIEVVIHPQSIVHAMAEYLDGSITAQLGLPDMHLPIQYALFYPERKPTNDFDLSIEKMAQLTFSLPDTKRYPSLSLAYQAGKTGGTAPVVLNAVNECCVEMFLAGKIGFLEIPEIVARVLTDHKVIKDPDLDTIIATDEEIRKEQNKWLKVRSA